MKKLLTASLLFFSLGAMAQTKALPLNSGIYWYNTQPKNDTVKYIVQILNVDSINNINTQWVWLKGVRVYKKTQSYSDNSFMTTWKPYFDHFLNFDSKKYIVLLSVEHQ